MTLELHTATAELIETRFKEGERAATRSHSKPAEAETECPYENEIERRWWWRGYHSQQNRSAILGAPNQIRPPEFAEIRLPDGSIDREW